MASRQAAQEPAPSLPGVREACGDRSAWAVHGSRRRLCVVPRRLRDGATVSAGQSFGRAVIEAVERPEDANRNALLGLADAFLTRCPADDSPGPSIARTLACRAADWCLWSTPENHQKLAQSAEMFRMYLRIKHALEAT